MTDPVQVFKRAIEVVREGVRNANPASGHIWREPLVSIVSADHPDFTLLPRIAAEDHFMPGDILAGAKSVIVYFIPFTRELGQTNLRNRNASAEWARAYVDTNRLIESISTAVSKHIAASGYGASALPATHNFDEARLVSRWSHRHIAWIAGMGSFGINNMLITERGSCGRYGSVVAALPPPLPEAGKGTADQAGRVERCRFKIDGSCGACVKRCVNGALTIDSFDRHRCYEMCLENGALHSGLEGPPAVCGKCATGVPCAWME